MKSDKMCRLESPVSAGHASGVEKNGLSRRADEAGKPALSA
ncbi:MAG: hypothetical protein ACU841_01310 [Gammaproteobacteria bacterium]